MGGLAQQLLYGYAVLFTAAVDVEASLLLLLQHLYCCCWGSSARLAAVLAHGVLALLASLQDMHRSTSVPVLLLLLLSQNLRKLIDDCWAADPEARPTFEDVVNRLEDMLKDMPKHSPYSKGNDGCQCSLQ